jgi:hypothetical protein
VVWIISDEDFESIMETLDVLADAAAMQDVARSRADSAAGRYVTAPEMEKIMAARGEGIDLGDDADVVADMHAPQAASAVSYRVVLRPAAVRALQRMPEKISAACWEFINGPIAENP